MRHDRPRLGARFVLDTDGAPAAIQSSTAPDLKHYKIDLFTLEAPSSARSVTYELHPSYYDPLREVVRKSDKDQFVEPITSYGDYEIRVAVSGSTEDVATVWLSDALRRSHRDALETDSAIARAIQDIERK